MLRTLIRNSLLVLLFHAGSSQAIVRDISGGNGSHFKHEEYYATGAEAFAACIATARGYGYTNPNCHGPTMPTNPPFIEAGWLRERDNSSPSVKFHLLVYYFNFTCPPGQLLDKDTSECLSPKSNDRADTDLCTDNPVNIATGAKFFRETDYQDPSHPLLRVQRTYDSGDGLWVSSYGANVFEQRGKIHVVEANGSTRTFVEDNGNWSPELGGNVQLTQENGLWVYQAGLFTKRFDAQNRLASITPYQGLALTVTYPLEGRAELQIGRSIVTLTYEDDLSKVTGVELPDGQAITYSYDVQNRLILVDNRGELTEYRYENASLAGAITSVIDGNGDAYKKITYYDDGRVKTSSLSNSAAIDSFAYPQENVTVVTNSLGKETIYHFEDYFSKKKVTLVEGVATASCLGANKNYTYYSNGQLETRTDWKGKVTRFEYNDRGLEIKRTEAEATTEQRVTDTSWHASFNLPASVTTAGQTITNGFNSIGRLVSRKVEGNGAFQTVIYTYNTSGLLESVDGPRLDVGDLTLYTYNTNGQIDSITNALGQVIQISQYSVDGQAEKIIDANGIVTELSYQDRGWLSEQRVKHPSGDSSQDAVRLFIYDDIGQIIQTTLADGSQFIYIYDDARRINRITNILGEYIEYTLDKAGNRVAETVYSASNEIKLSLSRQFDELSRLREVIGANGQNTKFDYDVNDNRNQITNGRGYSTQQAVDALDRIMRVTDARGNPVQYDYNALNQMTSVTDQRANTTTYGYNGLGQLTTLYSPDTGTTSFVYDDAGNLIQRTDARGVETQYQYDALNRVIGETFPSSPALDKAYSYDQASEINFGVGRLTGIGDASGLMSLVYDFQGRISSDSRIINDELYNIDYQYDKAGNVTAINYPSGRIVNYDRNQAGQVTAVHTNHANGETMLAENIGYLPFGPARQITYGNGLILTRSYDQDYRLVQQDVGNIQSLGYSYDGNNNIDAISDLVEIESGQVFSYDELDRLFTEAGDYGNKTYQYDPVGNRTKRVFNFLNEGDVVQTRTQALVYEEGSNRLLQRNRKLVVLDPNGNTLSDREGKRTFEYDAQNRIATSYRNGMIRASYKYNALGQRVVKQQFNLDEYKEPIKSLKFVYHYDLNGQMLGETIFNQLGILKIQRHYVWLDNLPIAQIKEIYKNDGMLKSVETLYLHADHLNAPRVASDESQILVWKWESDSFGVGKADKDPDGDGVKHDVRLRFPGQYHDAETGLYYNYFRDYDRTTGRYVQSDPIGLLGGINTFGYVGGNPLNMTDPKGLYGLWFFGNPLGGEMNPPVPVPLPSGNASIGAGGSAIVGPGYVSADSGIAADTTGNICFYSTICTGGGWNIPAGGELGLVGTLGTGQLCSGQETSEGAYWVGGTGLVGQGQVFNNGSMARGLVGVGGGPEGGMTGAGVLSCTTTLKCFY